jgi:hypothetical protein
VPIGLFPTDYRRNHVEFDSFTPRHATARRERANACLCDCKLRAARFNSTIGVLPNYFVPAAGRDASSEGEREVRQRDDVEDAGSDAIGPAFGQGNLYLAPHGGSDKE